MSKISNGQLWCSHCKLFTDQVNDNLLFVKTTRNIQLKIMCAKCSRPKSQYISNKVLHQFPDIKQVLDTLPIKGKVTEKNIVDKEGGILPLLPLLGAIFGGISAAGAAGGAAAGITQAVHNKQKADFELEEQKRHNIEVEKIARGQALHNDEDIEEEMIASAKEFLTGKGYSIFKNNDDSDIKKYLSGKGYEFY